MHSACIYSALAPAISNDLTSNTLGFCILCLVNLHGLAIMQRATLREVTPSGGSCLKGMFATRLSSTSVVVPRRPLRLVRLFGALLLVTSGTATSKRSPSLKYVKNLRSHLHSRFVLERCAWFFTSDLPLGLLYFLSYLTIKFTPLVK